MADLKLTFVCGAHANRFPGIFDGSVKPEGIELNASKISVDELFWRLPTRNDVEVAELSLTGYLWGIQHGKQWTAIPVFPGWVFGCHTETLVNVDSGIERPEDLKGKRVGLPEYPVTAIAWIRHAFETQNGVRPQDITWFEERANDYSHYRPMGYSPPKDVPVQKLAREQRLCDMLIAGEIDAVTRYFGRPENASSTHPGDRSHISMMELAEHPRVRWLYPDRKAAAFDYQRQLGFLQPIHCFMIKKEIADKNPWVPMSLYNAFAEAAARDTAADYVSPVSFRVTKAEHDEAVGAGFQPAGLKRHSKAIETALDLFYEQGYVDRGSRVGVEEFFHKSTLDT
jgi:4,5-dihydroxyphthalate decarboxylase